MIFSHHLEEKTKAVRGYRWTRDTRVEEKWWESQSDGTTALGGCITKEREVKGDADIKTKMYLCHLQILPQQHPLQLWKMQNKTSYWENNEMSFIHFGDLSLPMHSSGTLVQLQFPDLSAVLPSSVTHTPASFPERKRAAILVCVCVHHECVPGTLNNSAILYKPGKLMLQQL